MLQGQDSRLVDECNPIGPIFFEGVNHFDDWRDCVFVRDPIFALLNIHSTMLDDAQANVNDVMVIHWVACCACVGSANEEAHCKGLKNVGGMPGGGHSLPICLLAIFGHCLPILHDEPAKHVKKDSVWLL